MGYETESNAQYAATMGFYTDAQSYGSLVIGQYNVLEGTCNSWVDTEPLFVVGNGSSSTPKNAMTVYENGNLYLEGNMGVGTTTPNAKLDISATGDGVSILSLSTEKPWVFQQEGTGAATYLRLRNTTGKVFNIDTDGATRWRNSNGSNSFTTCWFKKSGKFSYCGCR